LFIRFVPRLIFRSSIWLWYAVSLGLDRFAPRKKARHTPIGSTGGPPSTGARNCTMRSTPRRRGFSNTVLDEIQDASNEKCECVGAQRQNYNGQSKPRTAHWEEHRRSIWDRKYSLGYISLVLYFCVPQFLNSQPASLLASMQLLDMSASEW
jgi:hypothetical protein